MKGTEEIEALDVLLFSALRQRLGISSIKVAYREKMTGGDLLDHLAKEYPEIAAYRTIIRLAVNQEYVGETIELSHGDEIALITPVSGG